MGLANSVWSALIGLAVIPYYLNILGNEAYGMIGFYITCQTLIQLLDMGFSPTVNREIARATNNKNKLYEARNLLHSLASVYWVVAVLIFITFFSCASYISKYWLNAESITQTQLEDVIILMGLAIACRWPVGLYQNAIIGAQRQDISSAINMLFVTMSTVGAVVVIKFFSATLNTFFIWQAFIAFIYTIVIRFATWNIVGESLKKKFDKKALISVWKFSTGMAVIGIFSAIFTQLDKIVVSKTVSLEQFSFYMLATTVVSGIYLLVVPVYNYIYPKFSAFVINNNMAELLKLYRIGSRILAILLSAIGMVLIFLGSELVYIWTNNENIAHQVAPVMSILAIGTVLHGLMYFPFALQLSNGETKISIKINAILIIIFIPLIVYLTEAYGNIGAAIAWFFLHLLYLFVGSWVIHSRFLNQVKWKWVLQDIGIPILISVLTGLLVINSQILNNFDWLIVRILIGLILVLISVLVSLVLHKRYQI